MPRTSGQSSASRKDYRLTDPWGKQLETAPVSAKVRAEMSEFSVAGDAGARAPQYPGDAISRRLDAVTLEDHMIEYYGVSRDTIRAFLSPGEGAGYGLGPDALSGYTAYAADMLHPLDISDETGTQMFPDRKRRLGAPDYQDSHPRIHRRQSLVRRRMPQCR